MGFGLVYFDGVGALFNFLVLFLIFLGGLTASYCLVNISLLIFDFFQLLQHLRSDASHIEFTEHFLHFLHFQPKFFLLFSQSSNKFISLTFVYYCLVLNFLRLIRVSQSWECLVIVISGWRYGANHECFWVTTQCILKDSSETGISVRNYYVFTFPRGLVCKSWYDQT